MDDWFKDFVGVSEADFLQGRQYHISESSPLEHNVLLGPHLLVHDAAQQKIWDAGAFRVWTLGDLKQQVVPKPPLAPPLFIIQTRLQGLDKVDITTVQQQPLKEKTMVVVASNYNCCENSTEYVKVNNGFFVTRLARDRTQGPAAVRHTAAVITRTHAAFYNPEHPPADWGQRIDHTINLLQGVQTSFPVQNGKVFVKAGPILTETPVLDHVGVGLHCGVRVGQNIFDQVFVSAMDCNAVGVRSMAAKERVYRMTFLLQAAYEGIYWAAAFRQTEHLILTLIGGGCFQNPWSAIAKAIAEAHTRIVPTTCLKTVRLLIWDLHPNLKPILEALDHFQIKYIIV